jgi:hypothetical protein
MKEKNGEHPLGDTGQLILFGLFLVIWILDSFILQRSTFLANTIPLAIRLPCGCQWGTAPHNGGIIRRFPICAAPTVSGKHSNLLWPYGFYSFFVLPWTVGSHRCILQLYRWLRREVAGSKIW